MIPRVRLSTSHARAARRAWVGLILLALGAPYASADDDRGWLGIYTEPVSVLPAIGPEAGGEAALGEATCGLRVTAVFPFSPAEEGGLLTDDIIIAAGGEVFSGQASELSERFRQTLQNQRVGTRYAVRIIRSAVYRQVAVDETELTAADVRRFWRDPDARVDSLRSGQQLIARAKRQQEVLDLIITLGPRPEAHWPPAPANDRLFPANEIEPSRFTPLVWQLAEAFEIESQTEDLLSRLARCHASSDPFRLGCMIYGHRDPFRLERLSQLVSHTLGQPKNAKELLAAAAALWVPGHPLAMPLSRQLQVSDVPALAAEAESGAPNAGRPPASCRERVGPLLEQITQILGEARTWHRRAFSNLTDEERSFLESQRWELTEVFASDVYIHFDEDRDRFERNYRVIRIAEKIDYGALLECALRVSLLTDPDWVMHAGHLVQQIYADSLGQEILLEEETPMGRIVFGGRAGAWYRYEDAAFILDLGGDDLYAGNAGSNAGWQLPCAVCIDLEGNDSYEATEAGVQGTGCLGVGGLLDLGGDDQYIGLQWAQGTGYLGIGWLHDVSGNDVYRGRTFCQGTGLFGLGLLLEEEGSDRFEGDCHVQAVGLAKGIGLLSDLSGDDHYYAKGMYPSSYGTSGIFESWAQGCGMGFRTLASGGLGALLDGQGRDRMEAGNFSQGGGYYYGYGLLHAAGDEDDLYIGSRYNQGFSAHQAVGVFLEDGGDDFYTTRNGVAQGLAWDECVTLFRDAAGNDTYEGGSFFSLGASAHNSFCFFLDERGRDAYHFKPGPARAGGNNYHGGTSFSLFVDEGGREDFYNAPEAANLRVRHQPEHGFFLDLRGGLETAPLDTLGLGGAQER